MYVWTRHPLAAVFLWMGVLGFVVGKERQKCISSGGSFAEDVALCDKGSRTIWSSLITLLMI